MFFKVYAQNCRVAKPIEQIAESELKEQLEPLIDYAIDNGILDNADDIELAYNKSIEFLKKTEIISCGDYCIVKQDNVPHDQPRMCGFDTFIFDD